MLLNEMELDIDQIAENLNAFEKFLDTLPEKALGLGVRVLFAAVLFFAGSKLIKLIRRITKRSLQRANVETGVIQFLDGLIKASLYGILVLMIAGNFGFDATSVVALVGSALLIRGEIDIPLFFMFLLVASRLYAPLEGALQNLAAVISTKTNINRMN